MPTRQLGCGPEARTEGAAMSLRLRPHHVYDTPNAVLSTFRHRPADNLQRRPGRSPAPVGGDVHASVAPVGESRPAERGRQPQRYLALVRSW